MSRRALSAGRKNWLDVIAGYRKEWEKFIAPGFRDETLAD